MVLLFILINNYTLQHGSVPYATLNFCYNKPIFNLETGCLSLHFFFNKFIWQFFLWEEGFFNNPDNQ